MFVCIRRVHVRVVCLFLVLSVTACIAFGILGRGKAGEAVPAFSASSWGYTLVIDAGHGGEDGGAVSPDGLHESNLNLEIAKRLEALMCLFGIPVVMTRESNEIDYPADATTVKARKAADTKARAALVESIPNALLISIHQNEYPDTSPFGAQALFAPTAGSQALAELMQASFIAWLDPENHRSAAPIQSSIYLLNHVSCPAVLVECGFLSNPSDAAKLQTPEYQIELTAILAASIFSFGGTNENENSVFLYGMRQ